MRVVMSLLFVSCSWLTTCRNIGQADVVSKESNGFQIKIERKVAAEPAEVYQALVRDIDKWWAGSHTFSGDASNLSLEAKPGGALLEKLPDGGFVAHLSVVHVAPNSRLVLRGGLGPLQDQAVAGAMAWNLQASEEGGCRIVLTYRVAGYVPSGLDAWSAPVDRVLTEQVEGLVEFVERGE